MFEIERRVCATADWDQVNLVGVLTYLLASICMAFTLLLSRLGLRFSTLSTYPSLLLYRLLGLNLASAYYLRFSRIFPQIFNRHVHPNNIYILYTYLFTLL